MRLKLFGGLTLDTGGQPTGPAASQRKALALLAVLSVEGVARPVPRERLLALLWPEHDTERARNALKQSLSALRRDVHADLFLGVTDLRLNPAIITTDAAEFLSALQRQDHEQSLALYEGPFLDAVHLRDTPDFDHWTDDWRSRFANQAAESAERLGRDADARADRHGAVRWWKRAVTLDPTRTNAAIRLIEAMAATGDFSGALRYAREHELLLERMLDLPAPIELHDVAARVRERASRPNGPSAGADSAPIGPAVDTPSSPTVVTATARAASLPVADDSTRRHRTRWRGAAAIAVTLAIATTVLVFAPRLTARSTRRSVNTVAVFPFVVHGDSTARHLGNGAATLVAARLDGVGSIRVADDRAIQHYLARQHVDVSDPDAASDVASLFDAGRYILGDAIVTGDRIRVVATVYEGQRRLDRAETVVAEGTRDQLFVLADRLAAGVLAQLHDAPPQHLARSAALSTESLAALTEYLDGETYFRRGEYSRAVESFTRATRLDSTFALAYYRLGLAADWAGEVARVVPAAAAARRFASRLSTRDQLLVEALHAWRTGRIAAAIAGYREVVAAYPDDAEAWYQLGEVQFHDGPRVGVSIRDSRHPFERALRLRPGDREILSHLVRVATKRRDSVAVDTISRLLLGGPHLDIPGVFLVGDSAARARAVDSISYGPDGLLMVAAWRAATYAEDLRNAELMATRLRDPSRAGRDSLLSVTFLGYLKAAQGRWKDAQAELAPSPSLPFTIAQRALLAALPFIPVSDSEARTRREELRQWTRSARGADTDMYALWDPRVRAFPAGLLSARIGDTTSALGAALILDSLSGSNQVRAFGRGLALTIRATLAHRRGDRLAALAMLDSIDFEVPQGANLDVLGSRAYERFLRAELLFELGRLQEALAWYESLTDTSVPELPFLVPSYVRRADIYARAGRRADAIAAHARVLELWANCDAELRPTVENARMQLASLRASPR